MEDRRLDLINNFKILRQREIDNKQFFKSKAYDNVIKQLESLDQPILTVDDLSVVKGLGVSLKEKAKLIIEVGYLESTEDALKDIGKHNAIEEMIKIMGIGNVKARSLVYDHGITSVVQLKNMISETPSLLNDKQKLGLKYHSDFCKRIPRAEMDKHKELLANTLLDLDPSMIFQITGSYRRGALDSGDIDILITHPKNDKALFPKFVERLKEKKYLVDDFASGSEKYMGVSKLPRHRTCRRIDIMYIDISQYAFALLYFTGSQDFNIEMRNHCLEQGYSLSEHGLKYMDGSQKGEFVQGNFKTEKDVFKFLGLEYVEPSDRKKGGLVVKCSCDS